MPKLSSKNLKKLKVPSVLIPGLILAGLLGWKGFGNIKNYYQIKSLFPSSGVVTQIEDGDTFELKTGQTVRLIGINAPEKGDKNFDLASSLLARLVMDKKVYLEYDRYQDDKFGRILSWVWVDCESTPKFLSADYMHKNNRESNPGLKDNPQGCAKGNLVNEELVKSGYAKIVKYADRGPTKYEERMSLVLK